MKYIIIHSASLKKNPFKLKRNETLVSTDRKLIKTNIAIGRSSLVLTGLNALKKGTPFLCHIMHRLITQKASAHPKNISTIDFEIGRVNISA
jgi:hypothetical protein